MQRDGANCCTYNSFALPRRSKLFVVARTDLVRNAKLLYVQQFCRPLDPKLLYVQQFHIPNQIRLPPDTSVEVRKQLYVPQFRTSTEDQQFVEFGAERETVRTTVLSSASTPKLLYVQQFPIPVQIRPNSRGLRCTIVVVTTVLSFH